MSELPTKRKCRQPLRISDADYPAHWLQRVRENTITDVDGCWLWQRSTYPRGRYGSTEYRRKTVRVHRKTYELIHGVTLTPKNYVCHRCDKPRCCNPDHLFLGTQFENMADSVRKGRHAEQLVSQCPKGHKYNAENTYVYTKPDGRTARDCKACQRARNRIKGGWPEDLAYSMPAVPHGQRPINAKGYYKRARA